MMYKMVSVLIFLLIMAPLIYGMECADKTNNIEVDAYQFALHFIINNILCSVDFACYWSHTDLCTLGLVNKLVHKLLSHDDLVIERKKFLYNKIILAIDQYPYDSPNITIKYQPYLTHCRHKSVILDMCGCIADNMIKYYPRLLCHRYGSWCRGIIGMDDYRIVVSDAMLNGNNDVDIVAHKEKTYFQYDITENAVSCQK